MNGLADVQLINGGDEYESVKSKSRYADDSDVITGFKPCEDEEKLKKIEHQLGYRPSNLISIQVEADGEPAVLKLYPLKRDLKAYKKKQRASVKPFPTMYWLSHPAINDRISILEGQGYVSALQERLQNDPEALESMKKSHERYAAHRWSLLNSKDQETVIKHRWTREVRDVGISGMHEHSFVKCLHAHYADYLATHDNIIGQWIDELLT